MSRFHILPVVAVSALVLGFGGITEQGTTGVCPADFRAIALENLFPAHQADVEWLNGADANGDGFVCVRYWEEFVSSSSPVDTMDALQRGLDAFTVTRHPVDHSCYTCHSIEGQSRGNVGPNLTQVRYQATLAGGVVSNTPTGMRNWLRNPQRLKAGQPMPKIGLDDAEIEALVAFLAHADEPAQQIEPLYTVFVDNRPDHALMQPLAAVEILISGSSGAAAINPTSSDRMFVTILGTEYFDPSALVDVSTLRFGPAGAKPLCHTAGHLDDENGDGYLDLYSCYDPSKTGLTTLDTEGCVSARTYGGLAIRGCAPLQVRVAAAR
ncbi:MAG: c-type cytochrome [Gemmatimonadales bacterium]|jgi:cytochrome c2